jgi:biopolymer transport protein ExbB
MAKKAMTKKKRRKNVSAKRILEPIEPFESMRQKIAMKTIFKLLGATLMASALLAPLSAKAEDEWANSRKLVIDTTPTGADVKEAVSQLPVLVRLHSGNFVFTEAKPDGSDLRFFAADDVTPLKYHVERYDATNELAMVWVQVPKLAPNATTDAIWVKWGNEEATSESNAKATYDAMQVMALNFSDATGVKDATGNANNASESTAKLVAAGPIGGALAFDGAAQVVLPATPSLKITAADGATFTAWVKPMSLDVGTLFSMGTGPQAFNVSLKAGMVSADLGAANAVSTTALKPGVWQHVAVVVAGGKALFYINGVPAGEAAFVMTDVAGGVVLGQGLKGEMDAVGLARTARSAGYLKAMAANQSAGSTMLAFSDGEEEAGEVSHFKILIDAVTIDGWVVIAFLGVMAVQSAWVFFTKTRDLSRAEKGNAVFLSMFQEKSANLLNPEHTDAKALKNMPSIAHSTIYQLYAVGMKEMVQRFDQQSKDQQPRNLTSTAMESIRASLDATIVRASQRFNKGIVVLTIAIAGGPFLGLLGTVVGVMITFAAIAAAGDVNVNAIAPGIAAALVATVAGLAVAIPALFAYNWFTIKIKNISADTQVFADEFLTKSAELYSN